MSVITPTMAAGIVIDILRVAEISTRRVSTLLYTRLEIDDN